MHFFKPKTMELHHTEREIRDHDISVGGRADLMYNYLDFESDRHRAREKFLKNVALRTSL